MDRIDIENNLILRESLRKHLCNLNPDETLDIKFLSNDCYSSIIYSIEKQSFNSNFKVVITKNNYHQDNGSKKKRVEMDVFSILDLTKNSNLIKINKINSLKIIKLKFSKKKNSIKTKNIDTNYLITLLENLLNNNNRFKENRLEFPTYFS